MDVKYYSNFKKTDSSIIMKNKMYGFKILFENFKRKKTIKKYIDDKKKN